MYNTKVVCTYHTPEVFNSTDNISEEEKDFIRNTIYRQELLNILGMTEFNEAEMNRAIHELYEKIKDNKELKECMALCAAKILCEDLEIGLMIMFAYDYMYLTHACICESTFSKVEQKPPLEKVEPKSPLKGGANLELKSENIKALIQLINL